MRCVISLILAISVAGCGTKFKDDREELSYLSALSNPTPDQWKRKQELGRAVRLATLKEEFKAMMNGLPLVEKNGGPAAVVGDYIFFGRNSIKPISATRTKRKP